MKIVSRWLMLSIWLGTISLAFVHPLFSGDIEQLAVIYDAGLSGKFEPCG